MAPIFSTNDLRARKLLDAAGVKYTIESPDRNQSVILAPDFRIIPNVHYRGNVSAYDLSKTLLPERTQEQHARHRNQAQEGDFVTADMPLDYAIFDALFEQKDELEYAEPTRDFIQKAMRQRFLITLTRPTCSPRGKDIITHNYGTKDSYQIKENIIGPDRFIQRGDKKTLNALLGTEDIDKINKVFNWINETNAFIYRLNEKPKELTEVVAGFGAGPDAARVLCDWHPDYADASLGVRPHLCEAPKKK